MQALRIHAGPRARRHLRERGLAAADVRVIPAAAGGPKALALNALDRFIFGQWLRDTAHSVHLLGASIGAWRMAVAGRADVGPAFLQLAEEYIAQDYPHETGKPPKKAGVTHIFAAAMNERLGARAAEILSHPRFRLHVITSRGRPVLRREGRARTPLGYLGAFASNLTASVLASCSIPFWLDSVHEIPGAPRGAYWDGSITDYHLHLDYAQMSEGVVLYPHFQPTVVPGWLDKALKHRHAATARLANEFAELVRKPAIDALPLA